jgi:hypothetical protein
MVVCTCVWMFVCLLVCTYEEVVHCDMVVVVVVVRCEMVVVVVVAVGCRNVARVFRTTVATTHRMMKV